MIRHVVLAAVGATALLASPAFAAVETSASPPEPYTAPDPVYTPHKIVSTVDMVQPKSTVSLTGNQPAPGTVAR